MKKLSVFALCLLAGCAAPSVVQEAAGEKPINTIEFTCTNPYVLEQDCHEFFGGTRKVQFGNRRVAVAGSKDGTIVLVTDPDKRIGEFVLLPFLTDAAHSTAVNEGYHAVRAYFDSKSVSIKRVRPVRGATVIDGYILELGSDGYSLLRELSPP